MQSFLTNPHKIMPSSTLGYSFIATTIVYSGSEMLINGHIGKSNYSNSCPACPIRIDNSSNYVCIYVRVHEKNLS